jgi:cell division protein FtsZ
VPAPGELLVAAIIGVIATLLVLRLALAALGWFRRTRRPEARAIRVVGVGGGGSNAVDRMVEARIPGASFVALNTDAQALRRSKAEAKLRIGDAITRGLGSGGDPDVGRRAAEEDEEWIGRLVAGADLVFVTAGLGGGTGSGAAPLVAAGARKQGALTIAVVTKPFGFEGSQRARIAEASAGELAANVDALIVVPNDRVGEVVPEEASMLAAFEAVDDVLLHAVRGIIDLVAAPGVINLDFADIRSVMKDAGPALIGIGRGSGENRAVEAARRAVASPLLEATMEGARGILFNISGPADLRLSEVRAAADEIRKGADPDANVIFGASFGGAQGDDVLVTLIATGLEGRSVSRPVTREVEAEASDDEPASVAAASVAPRHPPKRPARSLKPRSSVDVAPSPSFVTELSSRPALEDDDDLDVPSFLRQRRPSVGA